MKLSDVLCQVSQGNEDPKGYLYFRPLWRENANILVEPKKRNWVMIKDGQPILIKEGKSSIKLGGKLSGSDLDAEDWQKVSILEAMGVEL